MTRDVQTSAGSGKADARPAPDDCRAGRQAGVSRPEPSALPAVSGPRGNGRGVWLAWAVRAWRSGDGGRGGGAWADVAGAAVRGWACTQRRGRGRDGAQFNGAPEMDKMGPGLGRRGGRGQRTKRVRLCASPFMRLGLATPSVSSPLTSLLPSPAGRRWSVVHLPLLRLSTPLPPALFLLISA